MLETATNPRTCAELGNHIFGGLKGKIDQKNSKVPNILLADKALKPGKKTIPWKESNNSEVESNL